MIRILAQTVVGMRPFNGAFATGGNSPSLVPLRAAVDRVVGARDTAAGLYSKVAS